MRAERGRRGRGRAFLDGRIPFTAIAEVIEQTLEAIPALSPAHFEELFAVDAEARERARELSRVGGGAVSWILSRLALGLRSPASPS